MHPFPDRHGDQGSVPFDSGRAAGTQYPGTTDMFAADTTGSAGRSGTVSILIGTSLRDGDVDSTTGRRTAPTTPGTRTSRTATRTGTTRTTGCPPSSSEESYQRGHAALYFPQDPAPFPFEELYFAYLDCLRRKANTASARRFELHLERNLVELYEELITGVYWPGRSICFGIRFPKFREVWAADFRDRIVHHLFYRRLGPRFEKAFIVDSCASIKERGTLYAAERAEGHARSITQNWTQDRFYMKFDMANFFNRIDKRLLWKLMRKKIWEPWWLDLAGKLLWHDPRENYEVRGEPWILQQVPAHKRLINQPHGFGLPIGNLPSQFWANCTLDLLDQHIKHYIKARYYVRYVDDAVIMARSPQWLNAALYDINQFLPAELGLELNPSKTVIQPLHRGLDFVGHIIKAHHRIPRRRVVHHALNRVATMPAEDLFATINSYFGTFRQTTHSHHDRCRLGRMARLRGHSINGSITKTYPRGSATA